MRIIPIECELLPGTSRDRIAFQHAIQWDRRGGEKSIVATIRSGSVAIFVHKARQWIKIGDNNSNSNAATQQCGIEQMHRANRNITNFAQHGKMAQQTHQQMHSTFIFVWDRQKTGKTVHVAYAQAGALARSHTHTKERFQ